MFVSEEIYGKVAKALVQTLNVDEDDLTPTATLEADLGAASIDFLDIVFRLEREFGIDIPLEELFPDLIPLADPDFAREGKVTDHGMAELRSRMPYADLSGLNGDRQLSAVPHLFTVGLVARYITWKLGQGIGTGSGSNGAVSVPDASNLQRNGPLPCPALPRGFASERAQQPNREQELV
jgi:acyl carrier protein